MKAEIQIESPALVWRSFPPDFWESQSLYVHPEFLMAIAQGKIFYARIKQKNAWIYFPFGGQKILGKWRIFQLPYHQKFNVLPLENQEIELKTWESWFALLENESWKAEWAFDPAFLPGIFERFQLTQKTNQFLRLDKEAKEILSNWKPGRRSALKKSQHLKTQALPHSDFSKWVENFQKQAGRQWKPNQKETQILFRISNHPFFFENIFRYGIFEGENCICLVLLVYWNKRYHYLFSFNTERGFALDALTRFFYDFVMEKSSSENIFDFEGSNIPGVYSFFQSLGAEEEIYLVKQKSLFLYTNNSGPVFKKTGATFPI